MTPTDKTKMLISYDKKKGILKPVTAAKLLSEPGDLWVSAYLNHERESYCLEDSKSFIDIFHWFVTLFASDFFSFIVTN